MFEADTITRNRPSGVAKLMIGVFALLALSLFAAAFVLPVFAEENAVTIKGEVISVDTFAHTLTIKPLGTTQSSAIGTEGELTFVTDETANVTMCTMNKNFRDIRVGEKGEVTYHRKDGKLFADAVEIATPVFACYTDYE